MIKIAKSSNPISEISEKIKNPNFKHICNEILYELNLYDKNKNFIL